MFEGFFLRKRILITGVAGVKGSWMASLVMEAGGEVVGLDIRRPEADSNFHAAGLESQIRFVRGDVNDLALVRELLTDADGVFHLAAISLVGEAQRDPLETYRTNAQGTASVLEAFRLSERTRYGVFVTTDKVYAPKGGEPWVETDPLVASGPYPVSKACAEYIIADYHRNYLRAAGKRLGVARAGNVLIGGDFHSSRRSSGAGRIFVDCVEALLEGRNPEIYAPRYTRPYTYGLDVLAGYMTLMSRLEEPRVQGEAFNFGPIDGRGVENGYLADLICQLWGSGVRWHTGTPRDEPFVDQSLCWDKARERLGWKPVYSLQESLRDTVQWYKEWANRGRRAGSMRDFNRELITAHRDAARSQGLRWTGERVIG